MKILTVYTLNSHLLSLKAHISQKSRMLLSFVEIFEASLTNSVAQDQTAPTGSVGSGSTLFAYILVLTNKHTFSDVVILLAFKG